MVCEDGGQRPARPPTTRQPQIAECVEKQYPSYLAAGVSLQTRTANMQFLRNRIIETAKCTGMDVGLNLKRGGPSISTDFLVWRHDGLTEGPRPTFLSLRLPLAFSLRASGMRRKQGILKTDQRHYHDCAHHDEQCSRVRFLSVSRTSTNKVTPDIMKIKPSR
jgi:hypothetical protein